MTPGFAGIFESDFRHWLTIGGIRHPNEGTLFSVGLVNLEHNSKIGSHIPCDDLNCLTRWWAEFFGKDFCGARHQRISKFHMKSMLLCVVLAFVLFIEM